MASESRWKCAAELLDMRLAMGKLESAQPCEESPRSGATNSASRLDLWEHRLPWAHLSMTYPTVLFNVPEVGIRVFAC